MKTIFITLFFAISSTLSVFAQTNSLQVHAAARYLGDSIIIRWAPADFKTWNTGITTGYNLERTTIKRNGKLLPPEVVKKSKKLLVERFLPAGQQKWEQLMEKSDMAGVAAAAIYGENFLVNAGEDDALSQIVVRGKEQENRFNFGLLAADHSVEIASAMGLAFVDSNVSRDEEYLYKIHPTIDADGIDAAPGLVLVNFQSQPPLVAAPELKASFKSKSVHLVWNATGFEHHYSTYVVERSEDDGQNFTILNSKYLSPGNDPDSERIIYMYLDSLENNQKIYQYRLRGKTIFGELSPPSITIEGTGKEDRLSANIQIKNLIEYPEGQMQIQWIFDEKFNDRIIGFHIFRAGKKRGEYVQITTELLSQEIRSFTDANPLPSNYYVINAIDVNGYLLKSFSALGQLLDHIPPGAPENLTGEIDEEGNVTLHWNPNAEDDLKGYRVFISNQIAGEYTQITSRWLTDTTYSHTVTMNTLNEEVYFKVLALDFHENFSKFSEVCTVTRPDNKPPSPPVFISVKSETDGVYLKWANSSSKDVVAHLLLKKPVKGGSTDTLLMEKPVWGSQAYLDNSGKSGDDYLYWVQAVDDADLMAVSKKLRGKKIDNGLRPAIRDFEVTANRYQRMVNIGWTYPEKKNIREIVLFRAKGGNGLSTYKVFKTEDVIIKESAGNKTYSFEFQDQNLSKSKYSYRIMIRFKDNSASPPSRILEVSF